MLKSTKMTYGLYGESIDVQFYGNQTKLLVQITY